MVFLYRRNPGLEVLLLKRAKTEKGDWHPVTGNVEAHEAIPAAAMREVDEETGLGGPVEPLGVTFTFEDPKRKTRYHETAFAASVRPDAVVELSDEHVAHEWLAPDKAMERLSWPEQKRALDALVKRYSG